MKKETLQQIQALRESKSNWPVFLHVASTVAFIALAFVAMKRFDHWLVSGLAFVVVGFMQYRFLMAIHEATHKNLFYPAAVNEVVGKIIAGFVGMSLVLYRKSHLQHHKAPQTIGEDVDAQIYQPPLEANPGLHRMCVLFAGVLSDTAHKFMRKFSSKPQFKHKAIETKRDYLQLGLIFVAQAALFAFFWKYFHWWNYFTHWAVPLVLVAQLLDRIRTFVEHGYNFFHLPEAPTIEELPQTTVDIQTNFFEQYLFAPYGFDMHLAHHTQLTVPFYRLKNLSDLLQQEEPSYKKPIRGSYLKILWQMIFAERKLVRAPQPQIAVAS